MNVQAKKAERRAHKPSAEVAATDAEARTVDRQVKVALAAYFIAEKRGFQSGHELDDWFAAEAEIAQAEEPRVGKSIQLVQTESVS